mmetsp:Transcript_10105/g.16159  ORF Transcript_10105/g.16159 Transcript_10105/m.16159 type:complete len:183 (+) Transcript_10105:258-806(+)
MSGPAFWESLVKAGRTIYFPNIPLRLVAPNPEGLSKGLNVVTFITVPSTSKTEVRNFLQTVYKVGVERVHTINYEGKKKRYGNTNRFFNRPDYKKVYVQLTHKWFPPKGFAVKAAPPRMMKGKDGEEAQPRPKGPPPASPVKSGQKHYWLTNDHSKPGQASKPGFVEPGSREHFAKSSRKGN